MHLDYDFLGPAIGIGKVTMICSSDSLPKRRWDVWEVVGRGIRKTARHAPQRAKQTKLKLRRFLLEIS
jgi:hypothetical protein